MKRNALIECGDVDILFDNVDNLYSLRNKCGDYTKLETYKNIFNTMKGHYCLPLCYRAIAKVINNEVLKKYGINCDKVITLDEYYDIKYKLRNSGAEFDLTGMETIELV